jgi:hypothetical protein
MSAFLDDFNRDMAAKDARARAEGLPGRGDTDDLKIHHYRSASEREADGIYRSCFACTGWAVGPKGADICQRIAHCAQFMDIGGTCDFWKRDLKRTPISDDLDRASKGAWAA